MEQRPTLGEGLHHGREAALQGELTNPHLTQQHSITVHIHLGVAGTKRSYYEAYSWCDKSQLLVVMIIQYYLVVCSLKYIHMVFLLT